MLGVIVFFAAFLVLSASAITSYSPPTKQELWEELSNTLPDQCAQHGNTFVAERVADVYPYIGPEPVTLPVVHLFREEALVNRAPSVVMILCGFDARAFATTDVCMTLLRRLCSKKLSSADNIEYVVFPYVNERGRELVMHLWPEMTGQYSRTYFDMLAQVPLQFHRVSRFLFSGLGKEFNLERLLPTVQCFDGSERMTLLSNNWDAGWQPRDEAVQMNSYDFMTSADLAVVDRISTHGRIAYSDPETRIIKSVIQKHLPDILIEVALGKPAVLAAFDSPQLTMMQANALTNTIRSHYDSSISQANSFARDSCPETSCAGGSAAHSRQNSEMPRTGTVVDYAMTLGISRAFVVQVLATREPESVLNRDRSSNIADCISPKTLANSEESIAHAARWCDLLETMAHAPH